MPVANFGRTLVIANPAAHSGKGAAGIGQVERLLTVFHSAASSVEVLRTTKSDDARHMAADAGGFDTLLVLGGDGVIHEVVNGLMTIDADDRPRLGVIPLGSGNDFARTLRLKPNDVSASLSQLLRGVVRTIDLGFVTSDARPEGTYFAETLSFGLDAAIALDTTERRAEGTRQEGEALFASSALKMFARARAAWPCVARIDGGEEQALHELVFAIQNGPTYGGGFRICPAASPTDGLLDVCYNVRHPWVPHLLVLLGLARFGRHTFSRAVCMRQVKTVEIRFEDEVPCQVDGEELRGTQFEVKVVPAALEVLAPATLAGKG